MRSIQINSIGILVYFCFFVFFGCGNDDDGTPPNSFTDARDGNVYRTVTIGNQVWMAENLKYLPGVVGPEAGSVTTPYYYVNNYSGAIVSDAKALSNYNTYGVLYNWPAAINGGLSSAENPSGVQGVCPDGWHLPSNAEWQELLLFVSNDGTSGGKLKETGTSHWLIPNTGATNEFGFTALPGGVRFENTSSFDAPGEVGWWWSSTGPGANSATFYRMFHNIDGVIGFSESKALGLSVRCVKRVYPKFCVFEK
jgi:uncharacterized protein (TIGR02145 family)